MRTPPPRAFLAHLFMLQVAWRCSFIHSDQREREVRGNEPEWRRVTPTASGYRYCPTTETENSQEQGRGIGRHASGKHTNFSFDAREMNFLCLRESVWSKCSAKKKTQCFRKSASQPHMTRKMRSRSLTPRCPKGKWGNWTDEWGRAESQRKQNDPLKNTSEQTYDLFAFLRIANDILVQPWNPTHPLFGSRKGC